MSDNNIASSSSSSSASSSLSISNMPPPPPNKKRKKSVTIAPSHPTQVALPPPLIPYPPPHLMPSYYPVYHQHPYFLSVGSQPPISPSLSPTLPSTSSTTAPATSSATSTAPAAQRILPKSPTSTPTTAATTAISPPTLAPTFNFYPYPMQISPQLHPTPVVGNAPPLSPVPLGIRHNSMSSTTSNSTADQREQARKVSHSAIERRRRERINDKILQLKDLIPSCSDRENLHKMTILQSAIDYITYLKKVIEDAPTLTEEDHPQPLPDQLQKSNSMLPTEVDQFTNQFSAHPLNAQPRSEATATSDTDGTKPTKAEEDVEVLEEEEDEEDSWSMSTSKIDGSKTVNTSMSTVTPLPSSGLKPMDVIKLNKSANVSSSSSSCPTPSPIVPPPAPPKIIVNSQEVVHQEEDTATSYSHTERNMNLENILC
ncbi:acidPPc domain-containing protein [Mucor velutinosus]|uniref:AcidPPc domain-containing protein n=1 Tax=Mucor velutinosus TaxID=708070 RepID=A0AAN7HVJ0_9FUNG|nr:acidPPc domain-containing protein [Mucor velutinosus]